MRIFDSFRPKEGAPLFSGGDGRSFERAVVINCDNHLLGVQAEYAYVESQCGSPGRDWRVQEQSLQEHCGKLYDVLVVALATGELRSFYFDIGKFFGKL